MPALRALLGSALAMSCMAGTIPARRPAPSSRKFRSSAVDAAINAISGKMKDSDLATLFSNCLPNTLDTTVFSADPQNTFIITGDIHAMWQRDSCSQVSPYHRFAAQDKDLAALLRGLIRRQAVNLITDPYANAFKFSTDSMPSPHLDDSTSAPSFLGTTVNGMTPLTFERKYELDSLVHFLKLSVDYWAATNDTAPFDAEWVGAVQLAIATMRDQQAGSDEQSEPYTFQRTTAQPTDSLSHGTGFPVRRTGMIKSAFRPSDDATVYRFHTAANAMAAVNLNRTAALLARVGEKDTAAAALELAGEVTVALRQHAVANHPVYGQVYAYEVDGFGNAIFMDDANVPSLLSLPYLGWCAKDDPLYLRTRALVMGPANPWFFNGTAGAGIGGPHNGFGYVWPISVAMHALTSTSDAEVSADLDLLKAASAGTGFVHESFWKDSFAQYTRPWFAWANSLLGELVLDTAQSRPHLLFGQ